MKWGWLLTAVALAVYLLARRRKLGKVTLAAGVIAFAAAVLIGTGVIELPNIEKLIEDVGTKLGRLEQQAHWPVQNDLQDAALSLCPPIAEALERVAATGPDHSLVSGSGPTVFGLYPSRERAQDAARTLGGIAVEAVEPSFGAVRA